MKHNLQKQKKLEKCYVNPLLFFLVKDGKIIVWDYKHSQQFELIPDYFKRIKFWADGKEVAALDSIDQDLLQGAILSKDSFPKQDWGWDPLSQIFHIGTQDIPFETTPEETKDWVEGYAEKCSTLNEQLWEPFERDGKKRALPSPEFSCLRGCHLVCVSSRLKFHPTFKKQSKLV